MLRGNVTAQTPDPDRSIAILKDALVEDLRASGASEVLAEDGALTFKGVADLFGPGWTLLLPIDRGTVSLRAVPGAVELAYQIRFVRFVALSVTLIAAAAAGLIVFAHFPVVAAVGLCVVWALWVVGGNVLLGAYRFRRLMRKALEKATGSQAGVRGAGPGPEPYR